MESILRDLKIGNTAQIKVTSLTNDTIHDVVFVTKTSPCTIFVDRSSFDKQVYICIVSDVIKALQSKHMKEINTVHLQWLWGWGAEYGIVSRCVFAHMIYGNNATSTDTSKMDKLQQQCFADLIELYTTLPKLVYQLQKTYVNHGWRATIQCDMYVRKDMNNWVAEQKQHRYITSSIG